MGSLALRRFVVTSLLAWAVPAVAEPADEIGAGKAAPMFRLPVYNPDKVGATAVGLDQYVGAEPTDKGTKVVLLSFMASFCKPCKKEMPYLQSLYDKYKIAGLRVVMVSIDGEPEGQKQIEELVLKNKITFPVLKDRFQVVGRRWLGSRTPLPSVFLLQPDGTIRAVHRGYNDEASVLLAREVESALGVKPGMARTALAAD